MKDFLSIFIGFIFILISYSLALTSRKFYLLFIFGLFLILNSFYKLLSHKYLFQQKEFITLYLIFFIGGILADFLLGLNITKLWSYPKYTIIDYFLLYIFIYPLGGINMILSYKIIEKFLCKKIKNKKSINTKKLLFFIFIFFILSILLLFLETNVFSYICLTIFFILIFNYSSELTIKKSFFRDIYNNKKIILLIFINSYINAAIHEIPNLFAKEWHYNFNFFIVFFIGWLALTIVPLSVYYFNRALIKV